MKTASFTADTPAAALALIHAQLGPEAVVLSVRQLPAQGVARLLPGRHRVEVTAGVPEEKATHEWSPPIAPAFTHVGSSSSPSFSFSSSKFISRTKDENEKEDDLPQTRWRSVEWLGEMGLLPVIAGRLQARLRAHVGEVQPESIESEWEIVSTTLASAWRPAPPLQENAWPARPHVFIGPPGSGKTTALCKWLTQAVLTQDRTARVWRLDAGTANTAEFLSLHCEMLGVPVERFWSADVTRDEWQGTSDQRPASPVPRHPSPVTACPADLVFVDFPGVDVQDAAAMTALRNQIAALPSPRLHLVLNAAYETGALLAQWRAFEPFEPEDVILTHWDEELRRVKLWNLVLGTNCSIRFLSGGQKIPGEFRAASPAHFFPLQNRR